MNLFRSRTFLLGTVCSSLAFLSLLSIKIGVFDPLRLVRSPPPVSRMQQPTVRDNWMSIFQKDRRIGYARKRFYPLEGGFGVEEQILMRINSMGLVQDVRTETRGELGPDLALRSFRFSMQSGRFRFAVEGKVADGSLLLTVDDGASGTRRTVALQEPPRLAAGLLAGLRPAALEPGDRYTYDIFDPMTLSRMPVTISVIGREPLQIGNSTTSALKLMLNFQGSNQFAWLDESGDILQEKGMLGLRLEKTSREQALATLGITKGEDLTRLASVPSGAPIERPSERKVLRVRIRGVDPAGLALNGGRQQLENDILTVRRESLEGLARELEPQSLGTLEQIFLKPTPFIQSDHEKIRQLALSLAQSGKASVLERAAALVQWVHRNVEKRPTISVPDALAVLSNRVGDCNEHAVLLAALARAAGIPARIETGLVYQDGRFYYHAWNLLYLGRWITADAVLGQLPADVTHIRITSGSHEENRLLGVIGKVQIDLLGEDATARQNDESQIR